MNYDSHAMELGIRGTVLIPPNLVFTAKELEHLDKVQSLIPEEKVNTGDSGDTHDIYVRRIMIDKPGEFPKRVNQPYSDQILEILEDEKRVQIFKSIFGNGDPGFIRRCQMNRMIENSFIGLHLDADSNMDYEFSVVVQLGKDFEGGEFVVYPENREPEVYLPTYGTVLITTCKFRHEVRKVLAKERKSLVYFYSHRTGVNPKEK